LSQRAAEIKKAMRSVDLFICPSKHLREVFIKAGYNKRKLVYCDYGFDFTLIESKKENRSEEFTFGFIGPDEPYKGLKVLLEAYAKAELTNSRLLIHTSGINNFLEKRISKCNKSGKEVKLFPRVSPMEINSIYKYLDALIVPSVWEENSPLVIHEAFIAGLPVIASNIGGITELICHKKSGLLFPAGNAEELANMMELFNNDVIFYSKIRQNIPEVKNMSDHINEIEAFYTQ